MNFNRIQFLILGLFLLSLFSCHPAVENDNPPNVIFFIADDMTRDMFNCLEEGKGKNLSPNLDMLVSEGTLMMGQHVASPVCTPTRYNCLTGTYASRATNKIFLEKMNRSDGQTVVEWNTFITPGDTTIAEILKEAGYATGFVGKNHVIEVPDIYVPDDFHGDPNDPEILAGLKSNAEKYRKAFVASGFDFAENIYHDNPIYIGLEKLAVHNLDWITEAGLNFIEEKKEQPFFLYFATTTPHGPYEVERAWGADRRITPYGILEEPVELLSDKETILRRLEEAKIPLTKQELGPRGNVVWLDDALGVLIDKLKEIGAYENTIIVFFSDHGQAAKGTVYQGGTEDPSIIWKHGGFPCGSKTEEFVSNIDFAPTLLDLLGIEYSYKGFDGKSFAPILEGDQEPIHESLYFEMGYSRGVRKGDMKYIAVRYPAYAENYSVEERQALLDKFNARQKLQGKKIHHTDPTLPYSHLQLIPGGGDAEQGSVKKYKAYYDADQVYDLSVDPGEQINLFNRIEYKEAVSELKAELTGYLEELPGSFGEFKSGSD